MKKLIKQQLKAKEIIRTDINDIENTLKSINKARSLFYEKTNKIDKPLVQLRNKMAQKTNNRNGKGTIVTEPADIKKDKVLRPLYEYF